MFVTMRELGKHLSSHVIGRWLVEIGLRTSKNRPSPEAHQGGYVQQSGLDHGGYFYKWHQARTIAALEQAGHPQVAQLSSGRLNGPFSAQKSGEGGYQIVNGDGTVSIWSMGEQNAHDLTHLLNDAYGRGWFGGGQ